MANKTLHVLLIEDNSEYAELVQRWLSSNEQIEFALSWTDSLLAGTNRLARGGIDLVLLDLGLPDCNGPETFTTTRAHAGGVPIIILTGRDDESLALRMVDEGAQDYLVKGDCSGEMLAKAIRCAVVRYANHGGRPVADPSGQARVIGVMSAKGGVGATTVACNLAVELRRQTNQKTLLADLDVHAGLVSFVMNVRAESSILDAASNIHRLDDSVWESIVAHGAGDLHIVRSPSLLGFGEPDVAKIREVLHMVRTLYRWIVLDLGRLTSLSMNLLDQVDELVLITTTSVPALYEARRAVGALKRVNVEGERLRLVVNQMAGMPDFSGRELDRIFGIPVFIKIPDAGQEFQDVRTQGKLPAENGAFRKKIASLARAVAGLPEEKTKRGLAQFVPFARSPAARKEEDAKLAVPSPTRA